MDEASSGQDELETYLLLLLSDSALPTGGFVASSGLESFVHHGFIATGSASTASSSFTLLEFLRESLVSYAHLNLHFFQRAHDAAWRLRESAAAAAAVAGNGESSYSQQMKQSLNDTVEEIISLDADLEAMLLNHVTRRANKAQGIALLTLYTRAFGAPVNTTSSNGTTATAAAKTAPSIETAMAGLIDALKAASRRPVRMQGHLPICFAVLAAALGLSLGRSLHLHLFLQARAILSSAVRLNLLGPYAAQRMLLTDIRPVVSQALDVWKRRQATSSSTLGSAIATVEGLNNHDEDEDGPATTWPLGEILAARHDQLHSRIFNS